MSDDELFDVLFPEQVDFGLRKPKTWVWIMRRIRDGNDVKPPRNLIDLVNFAVQHQQRAEGRKPREYAKEVPIIEPDSLRSALSQLSETRVNDTHLAEAKDYVPFIESLRGGKAEHNIASVQAVLGIEEVAV